MDFRRSMEEQGQAVEDDPDAERFCINFLCYSRAVLFYLYNRTFFFLVPFSGLA